MRGSFTSAASGHGRTRGRAYPGAPTTCDRHAEVLLDEVRELVEGRRRTRRAITAPSSSTKTTPGSPRTLNGTRTCAPGSATLG